MIDRDLLQEIGVVERAWAGPVLVCVSRAVLGAVLMLLAVASLAQAGIDVPSIGGQLHLDLVGRLEVASIKGADQAEAWTLRTRLGYETAMWQGLSGFVEVENIATPDDDSYFDGVSAPNGKSVIPDPASTELNRAFLRYTNPDGSLNIVAGRQRIKFDDDRFVGNVGWRQNEQTYDAALLETSLGVENLSLTYAYLWEVHRIFGDEGPADTRDFDDSQTHLVRAAYDVSPQFRPILFAYLMDLEDSPVNSANTVGLRVAGDITAGEELTLTYLASYARQEDAGENPVDYNADYWLGDLAARAADVVTVGVGFEVLGTDQGRARFVTPLATAHKFNGFADAFLDNGGLEGLRDAYFYVAPKLPCQLKGKVIYHRFESDHDGGDLGDELDLVISKAVTEHFTVLGKAAHFEGEGSSAPADRDRFWLEGTLVY